MKSTPFALVFLLALPVNGANPPSKPAWKWTLEERLAVRADATRAAERLRKQQDRSSIAALSSRSRFVDVIDGKLHPELFLPYELFESLIARCLVIDEKWAWREDHEPHLVALGLPEDFWEQLGEVAAPFVEDVRRDHATLTAVPAGSEAERLRANERVAGAFPMYCRDRADALAAARARFGPVFDRFLYEYCARMRFTYLEEVTDPDLERSFERGCR